MATKKTNKQEFVRLKVFTPYATYDFRIDKEVHNNFLEELEWAMRHNCTFFVENWGNGVSCFVEDREGDIIDCDPSFIPAHNIIGFSYKVN